MQAKEGSCTWRNVNEEIGAMENLVTSQDSEDAVQDLDMCGRCSKEVELAGDNLFTVSVTKNANLLSAITDGQIPECLLWTSILSAFESCLDFEQLKNMISELVPHIPRLRERVVVEYLPGVDEIDTVAQSEIPPDGLMCRKAVKTVGDGNCLPRSLGKGAFNDPSMHVELRVRMVIEVVIHIEKYLSHQCLECGATYIHSNTDLPTVFATFSEYYMPGQQLTADTVRYIYIAWKFTHVHVSAPTLDFGS